MNPAAWPDFTPHGFCLAWDPGLIWLQAGSDLLIALAYYSIPAALLVFLRRRDDLAFRPVFGLFAAFILACGTTHVMGVITLWLPLYWADGIIKALTAALSVTTALMLWPLLPKALALPSPAALRAVNAALQEQIAEREAAAAALRDSEARLRENFRHAPTALHVRDAAGTILEVSDRWLALLGYAREDVIGRPIGDFVTGANSTTISAADAAALARRGRADPAAHYECTLHCRNGEQRIAELRYDAQSDKSGELTRLVVALTDITERKQTEAALCASEERLRQAQKMEAVGQLTGGIAHDFNNILTAVMGSLELLQARGTLDERGARLAGNAMQAASRAAKLTSQLLTFSRKQRLEPASLDLPQVIAGFRAMLDRTLGETASLTIQPPPPGLYPALADLTQLEMAILNLVINARDAIAEKAGSGGTVTIGFANHAITASQAATGEPLALTLSPGDYVGISVSDTGIGMPPETLAHVFEPFFTTKKDGAGTGLGLAQTYGFATQSGGTVLLRSTPGEGTSVEILLPRGAPPRSAENSASTATAEAAGHDERILLAEDDRLLRETAAEALRDAGFTVVTAENGPAALDALTAGPFDLLFTDVMMPGGMNGVELALAARRVQPGLRVTFTTGYSDCEVLAAWPETLDLLPKPYRLQDVSLHLARRLAPAEAD